MPSYWWAAACDGMITKSWQASTRTTKSAALTAEEQQRLLQYARSADPNAVAPYAAVLSYATGMRHKEIRQLQLSAIQYSGFGISDHPGQALNHENQCRCAVPSVWTAWRSGPSVSCLNALNGSAPQNPIIICCLRFWRNIAVQLIRSTRKETAFDPTHPMTTLAERMEHAPDRPQGFKHRHFHLLRHTYITRAAEAGVSLPITQAQVGHMCAALTAALHPYQRKSDP